MGPDLQVLATKNKSVRTTQRILDVAEAVLFRALTPMVQALSQRGETPSSLREYADLPATNISHQQNRAVLAINSIAMFGLTTG